MSQLRRSALALLIAALLSVVNGVAAFAASEQQQLDEARAEKAKKQAELEAAQATDEQLEAKVNELKAQLAEQGPKLEAAKKQFEDAENAVKIAQERLDRTAQDAVDRQELLNQRAIAAYKSPDTGVADAVLSAVDLSEAGLRLASMQRVIENDQVILDELAKVKVELEDDKKHFETEKSKAQAAHDAQRSEYDKLVDVKASAEASERAMQDRMDDLKSEVEALAKEESKIQATIRARQAEAEAKLKKQLESKPKPTGSNGSPLPDAGPPGQPSAKGFVWPVRGTVTSGFGQRWGRLHAGIDIAAPTGTPVRAAQTGIVIFAGSQGGYGNLILVAHGNGIVTAYAHLSSFGTGNGASVSQGQTIGAVGSTGNSTGPHLHFEVRVNGSPVNPMGYL